LQKEGPTVGVANFKNPVKLVVKGHRWRCPYIEKLNTWYIIYIFMTL
jgi:hypothetical protein